MADTAGGGAAADAGADPRVEALLGAARALEPFAKIGAIMSYGLRLPDDTPVLDIKGMGAPFPALTRGMLKDAYRARRKVVRQLERDGMAPADLPVDRDAPEALIAAVAARTAGAVDLIDEARLSLQAAKDVGGPDRWRDLYAAYWDVAHPHPAPIEPGVLQAGDRVMQHGAEGLRNGPATVMAVVEVPMLGDEPARAVEYLFDAPVAAGPDKGKAGGIVMCPALLLHLRDWPIGFLGFEAADYETRLGAVPGYTPRGWPA